MIADLRLAWRLAKRELRSGFTGSLVFLACLILGVAAIAAVGVINAGVLEGLEKDSTALLGGDLKIESTNRPLEDELLAGLVPAGARRGDVVRTNAMAHGQDNRRVVVGLKVVDDAYPLYGEVVLDPKGLALADALAEGGAVVERGLLARLDVAIGDRIRIGEADFTLRAVVEREPDRIGGFVSIGPRVFIHQRDLAASAIIQPGSLARFDYRFALAPGVDTEALVAGLKGEHAEAGFQVNGVRDIQPRVTRVVDRLASFLTISGLASLLIGGVGVALAIQNYLTGKIGNIAMLKCLGAASGMIFKIYLLQVLALALIGVAIGLVIGQALPFLVSALTEGLLPVGIRTGFYPQPLLVAAGFGVLTTLAFAIWPLARAKEISPAGMFRALLTPSSRLPDRRMLLALGVCLLGLAGLALIGVSDERLAMIFIAVALAAALLLTIAAKLVLLATKKLAGRGGARLRMALANLHRPGAHATSVIVALGAGLTVLTLIAVIDHNMRAELDQSFSGRVPSLFFIDIQQDQLASFEDIVADQEAAQNLQLLPTIRGRVVRIKDVAANQSGVNHWTLRRDRALSYSATMPVGTEIIDGAWWPSDYAGPAMLAIEDDVAEAYDVAIGDQLAFNVLGRVIEAEIAVIRREIDWSQGRLDAAFLFSPGTLEAAPHAFAAAVDVDATAEPRLLDAVAERLPNVTPISMREVGGRIRGIMEKVRLAILAVAGVTLIAGLLVLAGAVAAARRRHLYEAAVLKVLGARRIDLLRVFAIEYLGLGLVAALVAGLLGMAGAYVVVTEVMHLPWAWAFGSMVMILAIALSLTLAAGFLGTWRVLGKPAGSILRTP
ncbi:MAG: ABC transporter permease [Alphaproteobacteria bacterium]|nr:ABC transporter permease [Alphaproteobacteria bacterium]